MNRFDISAVDLNLLKIFEALFEEGGASRAAIRLDMTQSAVSASLRRLREVYSDTLFVRTGRGLAPTSRARELKPVISEALDKCRQSLAIASPDATTFHGRAVSIGLSDDFELALGQRIIDMVERRAPGLRIIFRQTYSQIVSDALANQEMDLAVAAGGFAARGLSHKVLGEGSYACLIDGASDSPQGLTLDEFVSRGHVLVSSGGVVGIVDEALAALGLKRNVIASTTHFAALPFLLKGTRAVATIPLHAAEAIAKMTGLKLLACPLDVPGYPIELGWRSSSLRDAAVVKVHAAITECFS
ncbi:LysR family transcriptional regulator [Paraburkholderia phenazinium]|jgi:LysR family transcriptional activator of mexEF-oprN operon|uniref:DNA-binding transcriptional regulator, LysR family n=1 Tax=Paraburkholderia phenazinium TaxID=60549 RepID=A0A1G7RFJ5_9BURK|nr:LysR family transcriptional regulator [Paraburkholderia phenazinium]SDG08800.1 DNA-binding transcriptional regulator, LysR family [Paraburkholderia phenazinium]